MNRSFSCLILLFFVLVSCQDHEKQREAEKARDLKKRELVFENIRKGWNFNTQPLNPTSQTMLSDWPAWRDLMRELSQKPQSSIGAFQKKARTLSTRVADLNSELPTKLDRPEMKSRIAVLITKINALNLFVNLDEIPDQKVISIISDVNSELTAIQMQMDEIERRSRIPREQGESEMIRMLDTSRAVPTKQLKPLEPVE